MIIFSFIIIVCLILTNAITDAPNAIATLVGTKVLSFEKATRLSAIFNFLGIIIMSFINISVADCISSMVNLRDGENGIIVLISAMLSVIIFALIALAFGIPTSETHGLIAGLTGSTVAIYGWDAVSLHEWRNVIVGLVWSVLGTWIFGLIMYKIFFKYIQRIKKENIKKMQILSCCGMSFMHGAQDGQKFIGIFIIFFSIIKKVPSISKFNPLDNFEIILYIAIIMALGVLIGGKKIVDNIGREMVDLNNKQALVSDILTVIILFIASITGMPVSTTHVKTVSIMSVSKRGGTKIDNTKALDVIRAWLWNFPVSGGIGFLIALLMSKI